MTQTESRQKSPEQAAAVQRQTRKEARARRHSRSLRNRPFFALFNPEGKSWKLQLLLWVVTALMLTASGYLLGLMNLYFGTGKYKLELMQFYFDSKLHLVELNVLPFVVLILFLWLLTNRAWISFLCTGVFTLIYSWAEYWKLMGRSDPIIAEDLTIIKEGAQMGTKYIMVTWQIALSALLVAGGTLFFFFFLRGRFPKLRFRLGQILRLGLCAAVAWGSFSVYQTVYTDKARYNEYPCWKKLIVWIDSNQFISRGCLYPFLYSVQSAAVRPPEGYSRQGAVEALKEYSTDSIPEDRKVNLIFIMGEAFSDLSLYTDRITGTDPYAAYHALRDESVHGKLFTNIFAAGTINTERCVVTGFPFLTNFRRASWSYARYFADQGYGTQGSHPSYEAFYNRRSVNSNLGFDD